MSLSGAFFGSQRHQPAQTPAEAAGCGAAAMLVAAMLADMLQGRAAVALEAALARCEVAPGVMAANTQVVSLSYVVSEHHLGVLADTRKNCEQSVAFKRLRLINDYKRVVQRALPSRKLLHVRVCKSLALPAGHVCGS